MIDQHTGTISFDEPAFRVHPNLEKATFLSSPLGLTARLLIDNGAWQSFATRAKAHERDLAVTLMFRNDLLIETRIAICGKDYSWGTWSEEKVREKKRQHDDILTNELGDAPCDYGWGSVNSVMDLRGGGSAIVVKYVSE